MTDRPPSGSTEEMRHFINIVEGKGVDDGKNKGIEISWSKNWIAAIFAAATAIGTFLSGVAATYEAFHK